MENTKGVRQGGGEHVVHPPVSLWEEDVDKKMSATENIRTMENMMTGSSSEGLREELRSRLEAYRREYPWTGARPMAEPRYPYFGKEVLEQAVTALLAGENLLLTGPKATGKNVLAENLAMLFGRPEWNVSFHINMDASYLIGMDTFSAGEVRFRPGPVYECAVQGGFCILDEINMARNEAMAVLHSLLDHRRILDVPGYGRVRLHPAARVIATMNYGYAGTRELNEALLSRFVVLQLPELSEEYVRKLLFYEFPSLRQEAAGMFAGLFRDLQQKCEHREISGRAVDLRGLLDALRMVRLGLAVRPAISMGISNKCQDAEERRLVEDAIDLRLPKDMPPDGVFGT